MPKKTRKNNRNETSTAVIGHEQRLEKKRKFSVLLSVLLFALFLIKRYYQPSSGVSASDIVIIGALLIMLGVHTWFNEHQDRVGMTYIFFSLIIIADTLIKYFMLKELNIYFFMNLTMAVLLIINGLNSIFRSIYYYI